MEHSCHLSLTSHKTNAEIFNGKEGKEEGNKQKKEK
jgi:hypothetical protein